MPHQGTDLEMERTTLIFISSVNKSLENPLDRFITTIDAFGVKARTEIKTVVIVGFQHFRVRAVGSGINRRSVECGASGNGGGMAGINTQVTAPADHFVKL